MTRLFCAAAGFFVFMLGVCGGKADPISCGETLQGSISVVGASNLWTFQAKAGDTVVVRAGRVGISNFAPEILIFDAANNLVHANGGSVASEVAITAPGTGAYTIKISDTTGSQTGDYRITLVETSQAVTVTPGDEGGPITNGWTHTGSIDVGDLDVWVVNATNGDSMVARMGKMVDTDSLTPSLRLYGPNGALLSSFQGGSMVTAEVSARATNSGAFLVVAGDNSYQLHGSGAYRLTLAKTGEPVFTSPGDEGGPMTNGFMHTGTIDVGDLDVWTVQATNGDSIIVRMGETLQSPLTPYLRLFGPDGTLLSSFGANASAAEVSTRATNTGTFFVVAGDNSGDLSGTGQYRLTLAKTGDLVVTAPGDEGGPMTNGLTHTGQMDIGDLDLWTVTATNGESIVVRMGEIVVGPLSPYLRLYGPDGALLSSYNLNASAAEVFTRATNSGTFLIVAADSGRPGGSGPYRLTLAQAPAKVLVSTGDEGGSLLPNVDVQGTIDTGDLDLFTFTACEGQSIDLQLANLSGFLMPAMRLFGPTGALLGSAPGELSLIATNSGEFLVLIGDNSFGFAETGSYRLSNNGLSDGFKLCESGFSTGSVQIQSIGGSPGQQFVISSATNLATPMWIPLFTNQFDHLGSFAYTNALDPSQPQQFFRATIP